MKYLYALILFSAKRFTMLQKGLNKKLKILKPLHTYIHSHKNTK